MVARASALVLLALAAAACGSRRAYSLAATRPCLLGLPAVRMLVPELGAGPYLVGPMTTVRFDDGSAVGVAFERSVRAASSLADSSAGPGDPFAYEAVRNAIVAWRGPAGDPHLRAIEGCLR